MDRDEGFIQALLANPDDDSLRLVYADWLDDHGDPSGEFLRVVCALRNLTKDDKRWGPLWQRKHELRKMVRTAGVARVDRTSAEDDVREIVFRQLIGEGAVGVVFLETEPGQDPSPDLLARLVGLSTNVRPVSAASWAPPEEEEMDSWGRRGVVKLHVAKVAWVTDEKCQVEGGTYLGPLAASGDEYTLELINGEWQVSGLVTRWIS